jgi:hypothetical protein
MPSVEGLAARAFGRGVATLMADRFGESSCFT